MTKKVDPYGIKNVNFRARVGTKISDLVELAGGYLDVEVPKVLVLGGPMMGGNTTSDDVVITQTTTSMIVLNDETYFEFWCNDWNIDIYIQQEDLPQ